MAIFSYISGVAGTELTETERALFRERPPWGAILFARNIADPDQVRALVTSIREILGREDAPVLIDQEGGRVQRLRPPHWPEYPPASVYADIFDDDSDAGHRAAWTGGRLIGEDLHELGINVDCLPVADISFPETHDVIGDRAYGDSPEKVIALATSAAEGLMQAGVLPVLKHIPGHGRAKSDSHKELPIVTASRTRLETMDFAAFAGLHHLPMAMTAHVVYTAIDRDNCATNSRKVIREIIRGDIGFDGLLMSDDLSMKALTGAFEERAAQALDAGCDIALHCNGDIDEMRAVAAGSRVLAGDSADRAERAMKQAVRRSCDTHALRETFRALTGYGVAS
ncbi:beta-N-acetylhexosaminidase [Tepidamorphus sp. 3E244]|uniref:beta-N-acetylhexosaminidase n=1 Tax=Tepidamorphus sp. 3E244 TaxID=3385498 RepID=UPI0038FC6B2A